eukprot:TRINITY_DN13226_c0_g1_i2.p2 TRINITY_DN13226_c0_g1~~TRINITY_DN13226_c0_g1_i2.p2  ORF type:complete len:126 (+),score=28.54 TRINITY_DN13226_c0_g1_i2:599-976(+)
MFLAEDVENLLSAFIRSKKMWDVIILDPPSLSPKKGNKQSGFSKFVDIHVNAMKILSPGGLIFSCSCSYTMSATDHIEMLQMAAKHNPEASFTLVGRGGLPYDHPIDLNTPESDYLTCFILQRGL